MSNIYDGGPAFPSTMPYAPAATVGPQPTYYSSVHHTWTAPTISSPGMSLRDWFAGQALAGLMVMVAERCHDLPAPGGAEGMASEVYRLADAMLAERSKAGCE